VETRGDIIPTAKRPIEGCKANKPERPRGKRRGLKNFRLRKKGETLCMVSRIRKPGVQCPKKRKEPPVALLLNVPSEIIRE